MPETVTRQDFFITGGALRADSPSYVERPADQQLRELIQAGNLCYVLTTRQMGKSSLVARTAGHLQNLGVRSAVIDLTSIGSADTPIDNWYLSVVDELQSQLELSTDAEDWWVDNSHLTHVRRFTKYIEEVTAREAGAKVAIFIDEIDSVLDLSFADDFFAAIRSLYNRQNVITERGLVSFVLLGVAAPDDLIKDRRKTPFNVGTRIELQELAINDAEGLLKGLPEGNPDILQRIFYWTEGHPYLTQKIGFAIAGVPNSYWSDEEIDGLVEEQFFTNEAVIQETNLQFVSRRVTGSPNCAQLLRLYRQVYQGKRIRSDERAVYQNELKLYGLVRSNGSGYLQVRNRIYQEVFDLEWIREHLPTNWWRRVAIAAIIIAIIAVASFAYYWTQRPDPADVLAESYIASFQETENPTLRLSNLANLLALEGYRDEAVQLFDSLPADDQIALMENSSPDLLPQVRRIVEGIYSGLYAVDLREEQETSRLLRSMASALNQQEDAESRTLRDEIRIWLQGRDYALGGDFASSLVAYELVRGMNNDNPSTLFERGLVHSYLGDYEAAFSDFNAVWELGSPWSEAVVAAVNGDNALNSVAFDLGESPAFIGLVFTPTPTATSTPTPTSTPTATNTAPPSPTNTSQPTETPTPQATNTLRPTSTSTRIILSTPTLVATSPLIPTQIPTSAQSGQPDQDPGNQPSPTDTVSAPPTNTVPPSTLPAPTATTVPPVVQTDTPIPDTPVPDTPVPATDTPERPTRPPTPTPP